MTVKIKYQPFVGRYWVDERVRNLPLLPKAVAIALMTCNDLVASCRSGIYEIERSDIARLIYTLDGEESCPQEPIFDLMGWHEHELKRFLKKDQLDDADKKRCMGYFNREKKDLLQYDVTTHCVFVKSTFKYAYNSGLIRKPKAVANTVKETISLFEKKVPHFLAEFAQINHKTLSIAEKKLSLGTDKDSYYEEKAAFEHLFLLEKGKQVVSANPKLVSAERMQDTLHQLSRNLRG